MAEWNRTPELLLGKTFSYLSTIEKIFVSQVCQSWRNVALNRPEVWETFYYSEDDIRGELDEFVEKGGKSQEVMFKMVHQELNGVILMSGNHIKYLYAFLHGRESFAIIDLIGEFCDNLKVVHLELCPPGDGPSPQRLQPSLWSLLQNNKKLNSICIKDIDFKNRNMSLPIGRDHSSSLVRLELVNSFRFNNLGNLMYLLNVRELTINPFAMNFSLLRHLASHSLRDLYLVANHTTRGFYNEAIHDSQWQEICKVGPKLNVHCHFYVSLEWTEKESLLKPSMPVKTLIYGKVLLLNYVELSKLLCNYSTHLQIFVDFSLTMSNYNSLSDFQQSPMVDRSILNFVMCCPNLHTLAVKEKLSSGCILLMAYFNKNWTNLLILEDKIKYVNNIPMDDIPDEAVGFVRDNWRKERFQDAMSGLLGYPWKPLKIQEYMKIMLHKYSSYS